MRQPTTNPESPLSVHGERQNGIDRLLVAGDLDASNAPILQRELDDVAHPDGVLVLDLRDVTSVDRFGVLTIQRAAEYAIRDAWRLCVVHCSKAVRQVFERAGLGHLLSTNDVGDFVDLGDTGWVPISLPTLLGQREVGSPKGTRT